MKKLPRSLHHPKLRGEWAELQFMARASALGFRIAKPISDCYRWDVIVEHDLGFHRVQVKSTMVRQKTGYVCVCHSSAKFRNYAADDIDFLAAYVIPHDTWFIIPWRLVKTDTILLDPAGRHGKYRRFREAWHLLRQR